MRVRVIKDLKVKDLLAFFTDESAEDTIIPKGSRGTYIKPGYDEKNFSMIQLDDDEGLPWSLPNKYLHIYEPD